MATATNIWNMVTATTIVAKSATQERYLTAQSASMAYQQYFGYVFCKSANEISESNGWVLAENQYPAFMTEEEGWSYDEAVAIDQELFWENLMTAYQGYAY